jgi:hypothetical protein
MPISTTPYIDAAQLLGVEIRTHGRCILANHISVLVPLQRTASLRSRSGATGKFLVKVDDSGHARTVGLAADSLFQQISISSSIPCIISTSGAMSCSSRPFSGFFGDCEGHWGLVVRRETLTFGDAICRQPVSTSKADHLEKELPSGEQSRTPWLRLLIVVPCLDATEVEPKLRSLKSAQCEAGAKPPLSPETAPQRITHPDSRHCMLHNFNKPTQ